jgi:streptogramin lyase
MRSTLRSVLVSVLIAMGGGALVAPPVSADGAAGARDASSSPLAGALLSPSVDQLFQGEGARAARLARRSSPSAIARRSASRSSFEGLDGSAVAGEAKRAFPELIEQTAGGVPTLAHGQRILRYRTNHAAEVSLPDGQRGLVESTAPLASKSGDRRLPFDLHLKDTGADFTPLRSAVPVELPKNLAEGVSLSGLGISLMPVDSHGVPLAGSAGVLEGAAVLWRHSGRIAGAKDLASVAKPTFRGLELSTMLLSDRSPGKLYFHVGMPAGARLQGNSDGSTQILKGKQALATIAPVSAEDAEGTSVPVSVAIHGRTLAVSVQTTSDVLYPIVVDPELTPLNDSQLAKTAEGKKSGWEFKATSGHFAEIVTPGVELLETRGASPYAAGEFALWIYRTQGVSHIYEIKTRTSAKNKLAKIESFLEFQESSGARETQKVLSTEGTPPPEYENQPANLCAANKASKVEECAVTSGGADNAVQFEQSAGGNPGGNYGFSDSMSEGLVSIAEPSGTHATTSYNTTSPTLEVEVERPAGGKEKVTRTNALYGTGSWLSRLGGKEGGAIQLKAADAGIGVSLTKLEYESTAGKWTQLEEHNYLAEKGCHGVQCYPSHEENWTMEQGVMLPDGEQKLRYKAEEAMSGTQSLTTEGKATVKVDTKAPHPVKIKGLPAGNELSERPYELTGEATDGEGTIPSSGVKSLALFVDGHEVGTAGGSCSVAKGACTVTNKWTVNGAELGSGKHDIELVALDNAGNEARTYEPISIHHSAPVALGPGSVDLQSGDFALGATDVTMGSGLTVGRTYSSRNVTAGTMGPFGPEWSLSFAGVESLEELVNGGVELTSAEGRSTIFAPTGGGKFESPIGDSNLELTLEENKTTKQKLAYYLKNPTAHTSVKFTQQSESTAWLPVKQEGTVAGDTLGYTYTTIGSNTEYPISTEYRANGIAAGPDGNLWYAAQSKVGRISTTGAVTEWPLPSKSEGKDIVEGPEGAMWMSEGAGIAKITTAGAITEHKLPEGSPEGIAVGPEGDLWFTEYFSNKIGKMTPAGVFTIYSIPTGSSPYKITAGPDGNMWYTDYSSNKIGKISTSGTPLGEFAVTGGQPYSITSGPDGNLWFTERSGKKVGKVTTAGAVTEYAVPASEEPQNITVGPDKNLFFVTRLRVDRLTTSGVITQLSVGGTPLYIATGSDKKLWFTNEKSIGTTTTNAKIVVPAEVQAPVPAGVSCATEANPGCRSLYFSYTHEKSVTGEGRSEWGKYPERLDSVYLHAYSPSTKKMEYTKVAQYSYDKLGRLRAEWDPRVSPALTTSYGYDAEGRVTALVPPGQEPWTFAYGAIAGDKGTGRLLKMTRASASAELWKGEPVANTAAPAVSGSVREGIRLAVSKGTWSGSPSAYGYQWQRCSASVGCVAIPGATNANYTPSAGDVGSTLLATVTATNGDGSVTATSAATATVGSMASAWIEYALPEGSGPRGMAAGPASNQMWFTDFTSSRIGKTTTEGTITEYALPASSGPEGIAKGPDGNMWFTDYTSSRIGKITSAGTITEYALPAGSHPKSIVAGPDGNLWFTDFSTNKIGKITTTGTITEYALPAESSPVGIASGSDGKLWFADSETSKIGKITTTGTITEYALPAGSAPNRITSGPDGNLWFVEKSTRKVGKITTSGTISEYPLVVLAGTFPEYITSAGEFLWVTNKTGHKLSRVSTSGTITEYAPPTGPFGIAANSLGELWYTQTGNAIGKLLISGLAEGEAKSPEPGSTLNYGVPVSGASAPYNLSEAEVAKWGQSDDPVEATAITPADEPQSWPATSYKRATIDYLDEKGRQVNVAHPSASTYGAIATTEYNEFNDVIRTLTPDNRIAALEAGANSVEQSKVLDTQNTFNGEGAKEGEVEEPGTRLVESFGPQHMVKYHGNGEGSGETKEKLARDHKRLFYDQGAPGGETYNLLTEEKDLASLINGEELEVRTTKTSYSGQSNLGWKLRAPTSVTVDPAGTHEGSLNLTTTTEYNPTTAQVTEVRGAGAEQTLSYATKFGEAGTEPGKLKNPWGTVVNSEGRLWVVDSANNRVEQFSSTGGYLTKFGEVGSGAGQLKEPQGIALDSAGHIWVADTGNNRVEEFSSTGTYMATVGSLGSESGKFKAPSDLAFDAKGNLWVADTGNGRVEKFDKEAKYALEFSSPGTEPGKLKEPKGIAIDSGEHVWVADTGNNRIQEFSNTGGLLKRFGTPGAGEGQLNTPIDLRIDSSGNIWTVDSANNRAESFTPNGAYVTQIGWKGTEAGQLTEPRGLAFDATGKVWVTDSANNRLEQWSKGPNAHDSKSIYYSSATNTEYPSCGSHPEWSGLVCETLPAKQPELMGLPKLPVTTYTYNMYNEPETITETFGSTTRTKKETYDAAGRKSASEVIATTGVSLPKVNFTYNSELGVLEKQSTEGEGKTLSTEYNHLGQQVKYTDADGNVAKYKYFGPENDYQVEEASDSSASGTSRQTYGYDGTTKLRTSLIDSAAGTFTASYDPEGKLTSVVYPYSMCANYSYNSVGEATTEQYLKTSNCKESEPALWYSDSKMSSVRGELLSQSSTLANETYAYDTLGRLTETQETPNGEGCAVRAYAYDESGSRASSISRTPGLGGACQSEGGTIEGHNYDEAGKLADGGMAYDGLGNVTKLPAADAEGQELTSSFYVDNAVASQTQGGVTNEYKLDPEGRARETTTGATKTVSHYDGSGEAVAWTESPEKWVRNIPGIDGTLTATQTNGGTPVIQLHDLQGNVVATIGDKAGETKLLSTYNSTEFGVPNAGKAPPKFAWLGASGVESAFTTGVVTYGSTSYVPQTGRPLQSEQVQAPGQGGGSGMGAPYDMQAEPWEMQGAARSAAETPGREAAREREAFAAALAAGEDFDPPHILNRTKAKEKAEELSDLGFSSEVLGFLDAPEDLVELAGSLFGDSFGLGDAQTWLRRASEKLMKCANNKWGINLNLCRLSYDEKSIAGQSYIDFGVESKVEECREEKVHGEWMPVCYHSVGVWEIAEM